MRGGRAVGTKARAGTRTGAGLTWGRQLALIPQSCAHGGRRRGTCGGGRAGGARRPAVEAEAGYGVTRPSAPPPPAPPARPPANRRPPRPRATRSSRWGRGLGRPAVVPPGLWFSRLEQPGYSHGLIRNAPFPSCHLAQAWTLCSVGCHWNPLRSWASDLPSLWPSHKVCPRTVFGSCIQLMHEFREYRYPSSPHCDALGSGRPRNPALVLVVGQKSSTGALFLQSCWAPYTRSTHTWLGKMQSIRQGVVAWPLFLGCKMGVLEVWDQTGTILL